MSHTPLPWYVMENSSCIFGVNDPERYEGHRVAVANCSNEVSPTGGLKFGKERDANTEFILRACNNFYGLVRADAQRTELLATVVELIDEDPKAPRHEHFTRISNARALVERIKNGGKS